MIVSGFAYLVEYDTTEDEEKARADFVAVGRSARSPFSYDQAQTWLRIGNEHKRPCLYVERGRLEFEPPKDVRQILERAKAWKAITIAHPWSWAINS